MAPVPANGPPQGGPLPPFVYVLRAGETDYYKVGYTGSTEGLQERIRLLQPGCPEKIVVIHLMHGDRRREHAIHRALGGSRTHGEWFKLTEDAAASLRDDETLSFMIAMESLRRRLGNRQGWRVRAETARRMAEAVCDYIEAPAAVRDGWVEQLTRAVLSA